MPSSPLRSSWTAELGFRLRRLFWLKFIGTTAWTGAFFVGYFELLNDPPRPVIVMPLTALDHWVTFQPLALVPYLSLWLYVGIAPGLQRDLRSLLVYGLWAGALCVTGLLLFYAWPTQIPHLPLPPDLPAMMAVLKGVDAGGNACPSMHVAISLFTACWIAHVLRGVGAPGWLGAINWLWFVAIAWSTLAVRQHVLLDVLGGVLLGGAFAWASLRGRSRPDSGLAAGQI